MRVAADTAPFLPGSTNGCAPFWRPQFRPLIGKFRLVSGTSPVTNPESDDFGLIPVAPETLRAQSAQQMAQLGFPSVLTLDEYALARNIQSEVGDSSPETKMALALSTITQARKRGIAPATLILQNGVRVPGGQVSLRRPAFGQVEGGGFVRFTSSSKDPTVADVLIARFALSGQDPKFARGADDQIGPNAFTPARQIQEVQGAAAQRVYWVGPITNVNPRVLFLFRHRPEIAPGSPEGQALIAAGLEAVADASPKPTIEALCPTPQFIAATGRGGLLFAIAGIFALVSVTTVALYARRPRRFLVD